MTLGYLVPTPTVRQRIHPFLRFGEMIVCQLVSSGVGGKQKYLYMCTHICMCIYIYDAVGPGMPIWMLINVDSFMSHANLT